jgi:hypothetical protein
MPMNHTVTFDCGVSNTVKLPRPVLVNAGLRLSDATATFAVLEPAAFDMTSDFLGTSAA